MYKVRANIPQNRLHVTLSGFFHYRDMKECTDSMIEESKKLLPGYDVITDISQFMPVGQKTLEEVRRGQVFFTHSTVRYAIRIRGGAILTATQFARTGKSVNYHPVTVATLADAETYLARQLQPVGA
jgi:hypothetical protein